MTSRTCPNCGWLLISGVCANQSCKASRHAFAQSAKRQRRNQASGHRQTRTSLEAGRGYGAAQAQRDRERILKALHEHGPRLTRDAISAHTSIKTQTVTWRVDELIDQGKVVQLQTKARTRSGSRAYELQLASEPVTVAQRGLL